MHYIKSDFKGYHLLQLSRNEKPTVRQLQQKITLNYRPLSRLSMDLKVMLKSCRCHEFGLCIINELTNYLITLPMHQLEET